MYVFNQPSDLVWTGRVVTRNGQQCREMKRYVDVQRKPLPLRPMKTKPKPRTDVGLLPLPRLFDYPENN